MVSGRVFYSNAPRGQARAEQYNSALTIIKKCRNSARSNLIQIGTLCISIVARGRFARPQLRFGEMPENGRALPFRTCGHSPQVRGSSGVSLGDFYMDIGGGKHSPRRPSRAPQTALVFRAKGAQVRLCHLGRKGGFLRFLTCARQAQVRAFWGRFPCCPRALLSACFN